MLPETAATPQAPAEGATDRNASPRTRYSESALFASCLYACGHPHVEEVATPEWILPTQQRIEKTRCFACRWADVTERARMLAARQRLWG